MFQILNVNGTYKCKINVTRILTPPTPDILSSVTPYFSSKSGPEVKDLEHQN